MRRRDRRFYPEVWIENRSVCPRVYFDAIRAQVAEGIEESRAEVEEPCVEAGCPRAAEWFCSPASRRYCDLHVPRGGCSCNEDEDGVELLGEDGRRLPCVDWMYFEAGTR